MIGVPARVDDGGASAIRSAVQVDLGIAEELADVVEIVHGDRGRVVADIGLGWIGGQASAELVEVGFDILIEFLLVELTNERI